jgi:hypothetical protein
MTFKIEIAPKAEADLDDKSVTVLRVLDKEQSLQFW